MQPPEDREQLRQLALASMPPGPYFCVLCGGPPDRLGAGRVDGVLMGYCLCQRCVKPGYVEHVIAKIRAARLLRRRN